MFWLRNIYKVYKFTCMSYQNNTFFFFSFLKAWMISDTGLIDSWKFGSFINHSLGQFSDFVPICYHMSYQFYCLLHILSAHLFFSWCLFHPGWRDNIFKFYFIFLPAKILQDEEKRVLLKAGAGAIRENSHHKNQTFHSSLPSGNWRSV